MLALMQYKLTATIIWPHFYACSKGTCLQSFCNQLWQNCDYVPKTLKSWHWVLRANTNSLVWIQCLFPNCFERCLELEQWFIILWFKLIQPSMLEYIVFEDLFSHKLEWCFHYLEVEFSTIQFLTISNQDIIFFPGMSRYIFFLLLIAFGKQKILILSVDFISCLTTITSVLLS